MTKAKTGRAIFIYSSNFMLAAAMYEFGWKNQPWIGLLYMLVGLPYRIIGENFS